MIGLMFRGKSSAGVVCNVYERPDPAGDVATRAAELAFVRDGFSWAVAVLPPLVLLARGAWVALAAYGVAAALVVGAASQLQLDSGWAFLVLLALGVISGFEAPALERWWLTQQGWKEIGIASGIDQAECERRFFDTWLPQQTEGQHVAATDVLPVSALRRLFAASR